MGLSNYLPSSRLIQPGVCTSSTRPASPFEGQVIYETDTNQTLTYSGSAWVMVNDLDSPPGLELIRTTTLSGTTTNIESVFDNSRYNNYRIVVSSIQTSSSADLYIRMMNGSTVIDGADYQWAALGWTTISGAANSAGSAQTLSYVGWTQVAVNNTPMGMTVMDVCSPHAAERTFITFNATFYSTNWGMRFGMAEHNLTTAYNGIQFLTNSTATMGGNVRVYGYRNSI